MTVSHFVTGRWYLCIALVWGTVWGFRKWKSTDRGREHWDRFKLKIPWKMYRMQLSLIPTPTLL